MYIDKYKKDNGWYEDPTGCNWEDAESFLQGYVLDFCGCGIPSENLKYIASVLQHIHNLKEQVYTKRISYEQWKQAGKELGTEQQLYFAYYFLDSKELTEHGSSVPGWLTDKGLEFLNDVNELYKSKII